MELSTHRILTTHVGSLPRPEKLRKLLNTIDKGKYCDPTEFERLNRDSVAAICRIQAACGIDVISNGEQSKIGYASYIRHRISGFEVRDLPPIIPSDLAEYPEYAQLVADVGNAADFAQAVCAGPVLPMDSKPIQKDLEIFQNALQKIDITEGFIPAASPGLISCFQPNEYYPSIEEYVFAVADAMKPEYDAIVDAGFVLQLDCPDLALGHHIFMAELDEKQFLYRIEQHVEALNHALRDIPANSTRLHLCWGNYNGPHTRDIPVDRLFPLIRKAKPLGISFEGANPRHEHEWKLWKDGNIGDEKVLIPGVIDSTSNFVEHPEIIADRIQRYANIVGRERVLASSDCGFGTFANMAFTHPTIVWPKLRSLVKGAELASQRLWM